MANKAVLVISTIIFLVFGSMVLVAQDDEGNPNNPYSNDRANACYEDGELAGKCDTEWEWMCGWYLIRLDSGIFSRDEFPLACESLLLPVIQSVEAPVANNPPPPAPPLCITNGSSFDIQFTLPPVAGNATVMSGNSATCNGTPYFTTTIVIATDAGDASTQCSALGFFGPPYHLTNEGFVAGYYDCETGP